MRSRAQVLVRPAVRAAARPRLSGLVGRLQRPVVLRDARSLAGAQLRHSHVRSDPRPASDAAAAVEAAVRDHSLVRGGRRGYGQRDALGLASEPAAARPHRAGAAPLAARHPAAAQCQLGALSQGRLRDVRV
eukprot:1073062-Prymnesium_polylepis.1